MPTTSTQKRRLARGTLPVKLSISRAPRTGGHVRRANFQVWLASHGTRDEILSREANKAHARAFERSTLLMCVEPRCAEPHGSLA